MQIPQVFISSTYEDLQNFRAAARDAAEKADFKPVMMEYFAAGGNPPLSTCLEKVQPCDLLIVIVAHRYGWIPSGQPAGEKKSITWLECDETRKQGKEVIAFLVDEKYAWPESQKEVYRLQEAMQKGKATKKLFTEVNEAIQRLNTFKAELRNRGTINFFTNEASLGQAVLHALVDWKKRHGQDGTSTDHNNYPPKIQDTIPEEYKKWLIKRCSTVELLAQMTSQGYAPPRLASVYVPAPTIPWKPEKKSDRETERRKEEQLDFLLDRFDKESLYVPGLAGSGKSTFSRWVALLLCLGGMPDMVQSSSGKNILEKYPSSLKGRLPVLIPFREFWPFLPTTPGQRCCNAKEFLQAMEKWAQNKLEVIEWPTINHFIENEKAVLLFDGADEIPLAYGEGKNIYYPRKMILSGLAEALTSFVKSGNRILLTSRPYGLSEDEVAAIGLAKSEIIDLAMPLQDLFMLRWFTALAHGPQMAVEMRGHLSEREELTPLSGNPVLLMAMCILYPEGRRLPQDKSELYSKTIDRLLFNRYGEPFEVENAHLRLSVIAHGMHTGTGLNEQRRVPIAEIRQDEIDKILTYYMEQRAFTEKGFTTVANAREELLSRSGLLIQRQGHAAGFYHFSFQEYLTGKRLVQLSGDKLFEAITEHADTPEWRATLAFAFGAALQEARSPEKGIEIITAMLGQTSVDRLDHLVLIGDLMEIVYRKKFGLVPSMEKQFQKLCIDAIEQQVVLSKRFDLGRVLGIVGDARLETDLRSEKAYVSIPAGNYPFQGELKKIAAPFLISRYPVTNGQYGLFINEGGYEDEKLWWSEEGLAWRKENNIMEPRFWKSGRWNGTNFPVVGVSFYEAEAFCKWAGGRLPKEQEWEAAAAGPKGLKYPWGDKWEAGICNSNEAGLGRTSPVGLFPSSRSDAFKLEDIAGNVWEWCADWYDKDRDSRVVRGGSFVSDAGRLRCSVRIWVIPVDRYQGRGFRVVRGPQL